MNKFTFAIGIHNHQPIGNFDSVFEEAHHNAYRPFLDLVRRFPSVSLSLHQSGILWDWQKRHYPDYFALVRSLVDDNKLELMTGGFFEPILSSIPERDARGQIAMLSDYLHREFGTGVSGLWLTERIWEPHLPKLLSESGVRYLPVDDTHFVYAGFELHQLTGPFVTENEGNTVVLLPIQKRLRYLIPFGTVEEVIDELKSQAERNPNGLAVYADDGEKFGVWPKTHHHCYVDRWLERFFEAIERESSWLQVTTLGHAASMNPVGRAYLPTASYAEMLHWSLPTKAFQEYELFEHRLHELGIDDRFGRFVRGGHWRGFLSKYEESNLMHKKMLAVSDRLNRLKDSGTLDEQKHKAARERLYAGQCNCPYWHGVFGGLYLPHIRQAVYENLIASDAILNSADGNTSTVVMHDYDADGRDEIVVSSESLSAVFSPHHGGMLIDLSLNTEAFCLTDTLSRRKEGYHGKLDSAVTNRDASSTASIHDLVLAKEEGLKDVLAEDWYLKRCCIDHFFTNDVTIKTFQSGKFGEEGDFVLEPYESTIDPEHQKICLARHGHVFRPDGVSLVSVEKTFVFSANTVEAVWRLWVRDGKSITVRFGIENNFSFQAGHAEDRYMLVDGRRHEASFLDSVGEHIGYRELAMIDGYRNIGVAFGGKAPATLWHTPLFTVSLSEGGFEKVYQGTTLLHLFELTLSREPIELAFQLRTGKAGLIHSAQTRYVSATSR